MIKTTAIALCALVLSASLAPAAPSEQLLSQIEFGLKRYNLSVDTDLLTTSEAAQIHFILIDRRKEGYARTRQKLKTVLRNVERAPS